MDKKVKNEKGFTIAEVVLSLSIILAIFGIILSIASFLKFFTQTDEVVLSSYHLKNYLNTAKGYCRQYGTPRPVYNDTIDGKVYTITETCHLVNNNLYHVSVSVCDSNNVCKTEEGYVSKQGKKK